jgi:hypothetical protein
MESNASWLPWLLWRMDEKWETYALDHGYELSIKPSDYFRRKCYAVMVSLSNHPSFDRLRTSG